MRSGQYIFKWNTNFDVDCGVCVCVCDDFALRKPNSTEINVVHHIHVLFSLSLPAIHYMIQIESNLFRSRFKCLWFNVELWQLLLCLRGRAAGSGDWTSKVIAGQAFTFVVVFVVFNFEQSVLYRKRCDRDVIYMMHMMNICSCTSEKKLCIYFSTSLRSSIDGNDERTNDWQTKSTLMNE